MSNDEEVELDESQFGGKDTDSSTWIDVARIKDVLYVFILFLALECGYVIVCRQHPLSVTTSTIDYPLVQKFSNNIATIEAKIEDIRAVHSVNVEAAVRRHATAHEFTTSLEWNQTIELLSGNMQQSPLTTIHTFPIYFSEGSDTSSSVPLASVPINGHDAMNISLSITGDLYFCKGFRLTYGMEDATLLSLRNSVKIVLFASCVYAVVGYFLTSPHDSVIAHAVFGATLILAMNPLSVFVSYADKTGDVLSPLFLATFRFYLLYTLEKTVGNESGKRWVMYIPFIVIYWFVETSTNWKLPFAMTESKAIEMCHVLYSVFAITLLAYVFVYSAEVCRVKVLGFGLFLVSTVITTLVCQVINREKESLKFFVYETSHVLAGIAFFFFQSRVLDRYKEIEPDVHSRSDVIVDVDIEEDEYVESE